MTKTMDKRTRIAPLLLLVLATAHAQRTGSTGNTCPDSCPDSNRPVCGTNNIVYRNECVLRRAACDNSSIRKKNDGPCVAAEPRNCKKRCSSGYQPVCATNGRTFDNRCKLSRVTCQNSDIRERYEGVCDVPAGSSSSASRPSVGTPVVRPSLELGGSSSSSSSSGSRPSIGDIAIGAPVRPFFPAGTQSIAKPRPVATSPPVVNTPRPVATSAPVVNTPRPVRNCPDNCAPGFRPVCGTDGQVYGNECKIRVAICKNPNLQKRNDGVCEKDCSIQCPVEINYVCGTNGRTYVNDCELTVARCKDPAITKAGNGQCAVFRETECDVKTCERIFAPICGSDGRTYHNRCELLRRACFDESLLRLHDGECAEQKCGNVCPAIFEPVCGTDGVSYSNHCSLINTACRGRSRVTKFADGPCRPNNG